MEDTKIIQFSEEYTTVLADPDHRVKSEQLVIKCGIQLNLKGCGYLIDAVILHDANTCTRVSEIYRIIGDKRNIRPKSVMRSIAYAIEHAFDLPERLSRLMGIEIRKADIHNALVIAYLGSLFRNEKLNMYA